MLRSWQLRPVVFPARGKNLMLFLFGGPLIPYFLGRFQFRHLPSQNLGRAGELAGGLQSTTKALSSELSREMGSKTRLLAWEMGSLEGDQSLPMGSPPAECYQLGSSTRSCPASHRPQGGGACIQPRGSGWSACRWLFAALSLRNTSRTCSNPGTWGTIC